MVEWTLMELNETDSTQKVARDLASKGAPEGTTVVAKSQSSGRGRFGRGWASPSGGLYMSFILRPTRLPHPELASLVSATAVTTSIGEKVGLAAQIRWPNDVMVNRRKLAGVIADAQTEGGNVILIVIGVGVNCNSPLPIIGLPEVGATTIREELGRHVDIPELREAILRSFSQLYERWKDGDDLLALWRQHVATVGRSVLVKLKTHETAFSGIACDIAPDGALLVKDSATTFTIHPEDIEWLKELP